MKVQCLPDWEKIEIFFRGIWLKAELTQEEAIQHYKKFFEYRQENTGSHLASIKVCEKYKIENQLENISMIMRLICYDLAYVYHKTLRTNIVDRKLKKKDIEKEISSQKELGKINELLIQLFEAVEKLDSDPNKILIEEIKIKTNKSNKYIRIRHQENISLFVDHIELTPLKLQFLDVDEFFRKRKIITRRLREFIHDNTHFKPRNLDKPYSITDECGQLLFDILKYSQVLPESKIGDEAQTIRGILQEK